MKNFLSTETSQGVMDVFVAAPDKGKKFPVVIILQEAFGVNSYIQSLCERFASEGFLAVAPELYHRSGRHVDIDYKNKQEIYPYLGKLTNEGILQDIEDTMIFLESLPHADLSSISTVGFCLGGFASVLAATQLNIQKMVSFYGGGMVHRREGLFLKPILDDFSRLKSQCLFFFGGRDASISEGDRALMQEKLEESKVDYEIVVYEDSDHGFFCDERKVFDPEASREAWKKTLTFLKK